MPSAIKFLSHREIPDLYSCCHETFDLVYILSGECRIAYQLRENSYPAGSVCLFTPDTGADFTRVKSGYMLHMGIDAAFMYENLPSCMNLVCDSVNEPLRDYHLLRELISAIAAKYLESAGKNHLAMHGLLFRLLGVLEESFCCGNSLVPDNEKASLRYQTIMDYINRHYSENICLSDLAEELDLTPQYLSRFFKKELGINFRDLLLNKRLESAKRQLAYTQDSITDIAIENGFSNITIFSRAFSRSYSVSPSLYRKNFRQKQLQEEYQSITASPDLEFENTFTQQISISVNHTDLPWENPCQMINAGYIRNLLLEDYQKKLACAKEELGFTYVRIQSLLSSSFIPKVLPDYKYYFRNLDSVLFFLKSQNLIPFFELSQLPVYAPDSNHTKESYISRNLRYFSLLEAFLVHVSTLPSSWTDQWCFELSMSSLDTPDSYVKDFTRIKGLIKKYLPEARLGGWGLGADTAFESQEDLFKELKAIGFAPDFISCHLSLETKLANERMIMSTKSEHLETASRQIAHLAREYFPAVRLFLTEWTSTYMTALPIQLSAYQAAFICRTVTSVAPFYSMTGYYLLAEGNRPAEDRHKPSFWSQGLMDQNGMKSPAYHAFFLLNRLSGQILSKGDRYCITKKDKNHYQILAFHYSHFTAGSAFDRELNFAELYHLFEDAEPLKPEFILKDVEPGTYQVTRQLLSRGSASLLDQRIAAFVNSTLSQNDYLMKIMLPTPEQTRYLQATLKPELRTTYLAAQDTLTVTTELPVHSVCLMDIVKLY